MDPRDQAETKYRSYLLRLWKSRDDEGNPLWLASAQASGTHLTYNFPNLDDLLAFLKDQTEHEPLSSSNPTVSTTVSAITQSNKGGTSNL